MPDEGARNNDIMVSGDSNGNMNVRREINGEMLVS